MEILGAAALVGVVEKEKAVLVQHTQPPRASAATCRVGVSTPLHHRRHLHRRIYILLLPHRSLLPPRWTALVA